MLMNKIALVMKTVMHECKAECNAKLLSSDGFLLVQRPFMFAGTCMCVHHDIADGPPVSHFEGRRANTINGLTLDFSEPFHLLLIFVLALCTIGRALRKQPCTF